MTIDNLPGFTPRNERIKTTLAADPEFAADVAAGVAQMHAADRAHAMSLATIRKAAELTQVELAQRLGVTQSQVSRIENQRDALLSTLVDYLTAAGMQNIALTGTVAGQHVHVDLTSAA